MGNEQQVETLSFAVRPRVVLKYLGQLSLVLAALTTVPLAVSLLCAEHWLTLRYAAVVFGLAVVGYPLGKLRTSSDIQVNEGLVITALVFILTPMVMSFPMTAAGIQFEDALFEAVSAITTTGLSTLATVEDKPVTFLFSRAWMQWVGGLGIVVLSVALLFGPGVAARRLAYIDVETTDIIVGARIHARRVLAVYIMVTGLGIAALLLFGVDFFPAVTHTLAAVSTGGFSPYDRSIAGLGGWAVQAVMMLICLSGAVSFALYYRSKSAGMREFFGDLELRSLVCLTLSFGVLLTFIEGAVGNLSWPVALRHAPLMALSAQTTVGFSSMDVSAFSPVSRLVLVLSMVIGGSVGSTAGGIKVLRLLIFLKMLQMLLARAGLPRHAVVGPRLSGRPLESTEIEKALLLVLLFAMVIALSWLPFVAAGYDPFDSLFEVVSATATVGLSTGITGPGLPALLKGVLCLDMLMGRVEIVAVLLLLYPKTWFGKRAE